MVDSFGLDLGIPEFYVPRRQRRRQLYSPPQESVQPILSPEESEGILSQAGRAAIGGLEAIGKVIDTPGSVIRGLLAGEPGRAFSGILDPAERVSGREILEAYGIAAPNQEGLFNSVGDFAGDVGGFGLEIATDPLTYFGLGALTKTGKAAAQSGDLAKLANQAGMASRSVSAPIEAGYAGVGSMFGKPLWTGPSAAKFAANYMDPAAEAIKYGKYSPVRFARGLFSADAGDVSDPFIQKLHEYRYQPAKEMMEARARGDTITQMKLGRELGVVGDPNLMRKAVDFAEGQMSDLTKPTNDAFISDFAMTPLSSADDFSKVGAFGDSLQSRGKGLLAAEQHLGLQTHELDGYLARYMDQVMAAQKRAAGAVTGKAPSKGKHFVTTHPSQIARNPLLANLGRNTIDDLAGDAALKGIQDPALRAQHIIANYKTRGGGLIDPDQANGLSQWAARTNLPPGSKLFGDPITDTHARAMFSARARAAAHATHEGIALKAFKVSKGTLPPDGAVPVSKVLEGAKLGFTELDQAGIPKAGGLKYFADRMKINPAEVGEYFVDAETAHKLTKYANAFTVPDSVEPFLGVIDGLQNLSRSFLTQIFPAYHFRNWVGGAFQNWTDDAGYMTSKGIRDYVSPFRDASRIMKGEAIPGADAKFFKGQFGGDDLAATRRLAEEMFEHRAAGPSGFDVVRSSLSGTNAPSINQLGQVLPGEAGWVPNPTLAQTAKEAIPKTKAEWNPLNVRGWKGDLSKPTEFAPVKAGEKWTSKVEFLNRASHFLAKRSDGFEAAQAAAKTRAAHFDYSKLSKVERSVARRTQLFYGFTRNNLPYQVEQLLKNPRKMSTTIRGIGAGRDEDGFAPSYIREGASIKLSKTPDGMRSYLTGFGLPIEEAFNRFKFGPNGLKRTLQSAATTLRPELRLPLEWLSGEQMMTGRPLERVDPLLGRIATNAIETAGGPKDIDPRFLPPVVEQVVSSSPASRALGSVRQVLDPRKHNAAGLGRLGLNLLSGFRTEDVEPEQLRAEAMESLLQSLTGERSVGIRRIPYLRKDRQPTQSVVDRFAAYKAEAERARLAREASGPGVRSRP